MRRFVGIVVAVVTLNLGAPALGQANGGWLGTKVVTKSQTPLKVGDRVVDDDTMHRVYTVEHVSGPWLWVGSRGVSGWVKADQVVPVDQATDYFTGVLRVHPEQASAYVSRAMIRIDNGEHDLAIGDLSEAIRLDPNFARAYNARGRAWALKAEYDKSIADHTEAIRLDPKLARAYNNRGLIWDIKKQYDMAIADLTEAIRLDPKLAVAYNNRGIAWRDKKDHDKAIADCTEAIRLDPKDDWAYVNRGLAWEAKKEHDKAIADYTEAIRLEPKEARTYFNRGNAWDAKKLYDKAIADYTEAIRLDPKDSGAHFNRGLAWGVKQEYDKAIADYTEAIRLDPKDATAYANRGDIWFAKREYDKAIADCTEAIRLDPKHDTAFVIQGNAWYGKKEYDKAIADYTEAIRLDPDFAIAYSDRARTWGAKQEHSKAIADATRACELTGWKNDYSLSTLADTYNRAGNFDAAVRYQEKAVGLYEDEKERQEGRARLAFYRSKAGSVVAPVPAGTGGQVPDAQVNLGALIAFLLVWLAALVITLGALFLDLRSRGARKRLDKQATGVSDPENDPIPEPKSPKEPEPKPVTAAPSPAKATATDVEKVVNVTVMQDTTVENPVDGKRFNPMGLTGFILGLCSMVLYAIGIVPILAIVFSGIGMGTFKPDAQKYPWMAYVGLGLGILYTIMNLSAYGHLR
jgi:tetratricopeptide (TPR) repeat protein